MRTWLGTLPVRDLIELSERELLLYDLETPSEPERLLEKLLRLLEGL